MQTRTPAVAGMFYEGQKNQLDLQIKNCFTSKYGPQDSESLSKSQKIFGMICPHAGYQYSGPIAAQSYHAISQKNFELAVIVGPNHWNIGADVAAMKDCVWQTPLGDIRVDSDAASAIHKECDLIEIDFFSHTRDHSIEVQIPMLQSIYQDNIKILPIILNDQSIETTKKIGQAIVKIASTKNTIIIGSSDFTHYESNDFAHSQDLALLEPIKKLDVDEFYSVLHEKNISACGYGAIAATMTACKELGATQGKILQYATSGDIAGDKSSVVGYGAVVFI